MTAMSNATHDMLTERMHRAQRLADTLRENLPRVSCYEEFVAASDAIARYEAEARDWHKQLVEVRGW